MAKFFVFFLSFTHLLISLPTYSQNEGEAKPAGRGAELYKQCIQCHGERGEGNPAQKAPKLNGQYAWYIEKQILDMKAQVVRKNAVMLPFISKLTNDDIKELSVFISAL